MFKNKYIKYKNKYLKLKNKIEKNKFDKFDENKFGGMFQINPINISNISNLSGVKTIDDYSNTKLTKELYFSIIEAGRMDGYYQYDTPKYFIEETKKIETILKKLKEKKNVDELYVLCPGDSPYKIIKYFEKLSLCKFCKFVSFPFSKPLVNEYNPDTTFNYLEKYIPNDYSNLIILDSINTCDTIRIILNSMTLKNEKNPNSKYYHDNKKIIQEINDLLYYYENKKKPENNNYIINLYDFVQKPFLQNYLFVSELNKTRCVPTLNIHSNEYIEPLFNNENCNYFIDVMVLTNLYYKWYEEYFDKKNKYNEYDYDYDYDYEND